MIACTSRAAEERLLGIPFASGRNESSTPAAMVAAAKISGSRSAAPAIRPELRAPGIASGGGGTACLAPARQPADRHQRQQAGGGRHRRGRGGQVVSGEPDPGRQRDNGRDAGDDAEQAEPLTAPSGRQQLGGERAGGHAAQAEAEPAHHADAYHDGLGLACEHGQGRRAEQHGSGREHHPVAEPPDRCRGHGLGRHGAEQQGPGDQPGSGAAGAGRRRQHRHHRQQQEEAGERRELGQERGGQRHAEEPGRNRGTRLRLRQGAHSTHGRTQPARW